MRTTLWLTIALIVIGVSVIAVYLAAFLIQYPPILTGLGQALPWIGIIIGGLGLLLNFLKYLTDSKEKRDEKLRQHTKILNDEVYKRLLHIFVEPTGSYCRKKACMVPVSEKEFKEYELQLTLDPYEVEGKHKKQILIPLSKIESLELGISHLKDPQHQDVYEPWKKLEDLVLEHNGLIDSLDKELIQTIREKMRENFSTLTDQYPDRREEVMSNTYDSDQINRFINRYVLSSRAQKRQPKFENSLKQIQEKQSQSSSAHWMITPIEWTYIYLVDSITEIDLKKLEATLREIIGDGEIMKNFQRLIDLDGEIFQSIRALEKSIQKLVKDIDNRLLDYTIKGTCKGCEKWNK